MPEPWLQSKTTWMDSERHIPMFECRVPGSEFIFFRILGPTINFKACLLQVA